MTLSLNSIHAGDCLELLGQIRDLVEAKEALR